MSAARDPRPAALVLALALGLGLATCASSTETANDTTDTAADDPATGATQGTQIEPELDANGRLVLPTTTAPIIVVPAAVDEALELAGAEATVEIGQELCKLVVTFETEEIGFAFDSDELSPTGHASIELAASEFSDAEVVVITGHSSAEGEPSYNTDLSRRRAEAVAAVLRPLLTHTAITVEGVGYSEPIATNDTDEGRAQNRRVVITADVQREECTQ